MYNLKIEDISKVTRSVLEMLNIEPFNPKGEGMPVEFMDHGSSQEEKPVFCLPEDIEPYPNRELLIAAVNQALKDMTEAAERRNKESRKIVLHSVAGKMHDLVTTLNPLDVTAQELADELQEDQLTDFRNGMIVLGRTVAELLERKHGSRQYALSDLFGE